MATKIFQSYIIVGDKKQTQDKVDNLLNSLDIKLKVSPDITITVPEKSISVDTIRQIKASIYQKPFSLKYKVNIIREAEKLTIEAQNALLKIFEEPPANAIIILETSNPKNLLETLRSRAVFINVVPEKIMAGQGETKSLKEALLSIRELTDPASWIDQEIKNYYQILKKQIEGKQPFTGTTKTIEVYKEAKLMAGANVNPKFVLANAILSTQLP